MRVSVRGGRLNGGTLALAAAFLCVPFLSGCGGGGNPVDTAVSAGDETIEMVFVHGGTFTMGCTAEQLDNCYNDEYPAHQVTLSNFYIGKYEVTQAQWTAVMGDNPSYHTGDNLRQYFTGDTSSPYYFTGDSLPPYFTGGSLPVYLAGDKLPAYFTADNLPVENITWDDVQEFIARLNAMTGKGYRLPTEAEWEYAARGGANSRGYIYSGSDKIKDVAWYAGNSDRTVQPVGTRMPNELGIYDMTGNVWELVNDWYGDYAPEAETDPRGPVSGVSKIYRGGCWDGNLGGQRVSRRSPYALNQRDRQFGFRLARSQSNTVEPVKFSIGGKTLDMALVKAGTFTMGCTDTNDYCHAREIPAHQVTITKDFYIGKYEVTQAQWKAVMDDNPSGFIDDSFPVETVDYDDVQTFISKLNKATGKNYRLPTEAEWEYAARGGTKSGGYKYSGGDNLDSVAWNINNAGSTTHTVGTKAPNELGIHDMTGNVWEWVNDWYADYTPEAQTDPAGPQSGERRVFRGSSWLCSDPNFRRIPYRFTSPAGSAYSFVGFRLAHSK